MNALVIVPWIIVLLVYAGPSIARVARKDWLRLRSAGWFAVVMALLALRAATLHGGSKGGSTNEPPVIPPAPVKVIRLYYEDASGKLFPFDARLKEVQP